MRFDFIFLEYLYTINIASYFFTLTVYTFDPRLEGLEQVLSETCTNYPHITITLSAYTPDIGFVVIYDDFYFVLQKPRTTLHYPKLVKLNPIRYVDEEYYPFNAIVRVGEFMRTESKYYALKHDKADPEKIMRYYEMYYLNANASEIKEVNLRNSFLNIDGLPKVEAIIAALIIPTSHNDYFSGIIYNMTNDDNNVVTEIKFKVNGNVLVAKSSIETDSATGDNRISTLDIFDFIQHQTAIGYRSYGSSFRYFSGDENKPVSNANCVSTLSLSCQQSIVGNSAWFDNQVLIGCPPTLCYAAQLDAATIGPNKQLYVFFGFYYWSLSSSKKQFPSVESAKRLDSINVLSLGDIVSFPIFASFTYQARMYIFGDVCSICAYCMHSIIIVTQRNKLWVSATGVFDQFTVYNVQDIFTEFGNSFWLDGIDAAFCNEQLHLLFVFKGSNYYVFDLKNREFSSKYLHSFPLGENTYPRPIFDFGIPEQIDAAFVMNDVVYFLYAEFAYEISKWDKESGAALEMSKLRLIEDILIDCTNYDYTKTEYRSRQQRQTFVMNVTAETAAADKEISKFSKSSKHL
ncbi:hypothetical protein B4U80_13040 [Leptotrombidium deliense]|uniref:Uncharacterized protein n=1 Tax=Leptotrombidium deliense TaxID=299467 RepID=A0A443SV31_9ACAR|nr:hypothetical protein B4U80_13040 [Leptotrombidium deliense]